MSGKKTLAQRHWNLIIYLLLSCQRVSREQKFHSSARNYKWNLERTSNSCQSTHSAGRVLWEELLEEVILLPHVLNLHTLSKDKCMCLQDKWKLKVTRPAGQVQYFCPLVSSALDLYWLVLAFLRVYQIPCQILVCCFPFSLPLCRNGQDHLNLVDLVIKLQQKTILPLCRGSYEGCLLQCVLMVTSLYLFGQVQPIWLHWTFVLQLHSLV